MKEKSVHLSGEVLSGPHSWASQGLWFAGLGMRGIWWRCVFLIYSGFSYLHSGVLSVIMRLGFFWGSNDLPPNSRKSTGKIQTTTMPLKILSHYLIFLKISLAILFTAIIVPNFPGLSTNVVNVCWNITCSVENA